MARKSRPADRVLAFFDPLFGGSSLVVELDDLLGKPLQVGHNETDPRKEFSGMPFHLWQARDVADPNFSLGKRNCDRKPSAASTAAPPGESVNARFCAAASD